MTKALISVTGLDATGIIASVATKLAELNINILDITQTILGGYFTMMMVVDLDGANMEFAAVDEALQPIRDNMKMTIHIQRMDIFDAMHRI
ncbi:MAG: ACT domain-containing protein [Aristaeellaceae bacterium]